MPHRQIHQALPEAERLPLDSRISKNVKLNSFDFSNIKFEDPGINNETELIALGTYDGRNDLNSPDDLPTILNFPRIDPCKEEHSTLIKEKLEKDGINLFKTYNEEARKEEKKIYAGTIVLFDKKNGIAAKVPVYNQEVLVKFFLNKCYMKISDVKYVNDINTDEEEVKLEKERNVNLLKDFCKEVIKNPNYIDDHLNLK